MWKVEGENYKKLRFIIKDKDQQVKPMLVLDEKVWNERIKTECSKGYEAEFVKVQQYSYKTDDWKEVKWFTVILRDDVDGEVRFSSAWTNPSQRFMNYLLGWDWTIKKLKISFSFKDYNWKPQVTLRCNINGELWGMLISKDEMNEQKLVYPIVDPETQEVQKYSYRKLQEFFESKYTDFNKKSQSNVWAELEAEAEAKEEAAKEEVKREVEYWHSEVKQTLKEKIQTKEKDDDFLPF